MVVGVFFLSLLLQGKINAAEPAKLPYRQLVLGVDPMDTEGLKRNLAAVLRKYYSRTFGGSDNWERIESVRFDGLLHLEDRTLRFIAFKKKPDYCKVAIMTGGGARMVLAYDGSDAWQINTSQPEPEAVSMPPKEARNFIRDATVGGHLLYPLLEGKEIRLLGAEDVEGDLCYQIEIILRGGDRIISSLDITDFSERHQTTINVVNGLEEQTFFSDFRKIEGVRFPFASVMESDGELVHRVEMLDIQVNQGVMPWMFQRPSGAYIPGETPEPGEMDLLPPPVDSEPSEFDDSLLDAPGGTAFPDIEESERRSILDDIGKPVR